VKNHETSLCIHDLIRNDAKFSRIPVLILLSPTLAFSDDVTYQLKKSLVDVPYNVQ